MNCLWYAALHLGEYGSTRIDQSISALARGRPFEHSSSPKRSYSGLEICSHNLSRARRQKLTTYHMMKSYLAMLLVAVVSGQTAYPTPTPRGMYSSPGPEPTPSPPAPTNTPTAAPTDSITINSKFTTIRHCAVAMMDRYIHAGKKWNCCDEGSGQWGFCDGTHLNASRRLKEDDVPELSLSFGKLFAFYESSVVWKK